MAIAAEGPSALKLQQGNAVIALGSRVGGTTYTPGPLSCSPFAAGETTADWWKFGRWGS